MNILFLISVTSTIIIILLTFFVIYLVYVYRKLLEKYSKLSITTDRFEINKKIQSQTDHFMDKKIDDAITKATGEAVTIISKTTDNISKNIKRTSLEKLIEIEKGEDKAVEGEYDKAKMEIEKFKEEEVAKIRQRATEVLGKVTSEVLPELLDKELQEALLTKSIENAKRSNLF